jgi:hypothetical protein
MIQSNDPTRLCCANCRFLMLVKREPQPGRPAIVGQGPIPICFGGPPSLIMTSRGPLPSRGVPCNPDDMACALWEGRPDISVSDIPEPAPEELGDTKP